MASSTENPVANAPAPANDTSLQSIIASYLKKKGYNRSIEGLAADLGTSVDKIAVATDLINDATVLQAVLNYNSTEKFPGSFEQSFKALSVWIDRSLDQCKVCGGYNDHSHFTLLLFHHFCPSMAISSFDAGINHSYFLSYLRYDCVVLAA